MRFVLISSIRLPFRLSVSWLKVLSSRTVRIPQKSNPLDNVQ